MPRGNETKAAAGAGTLSATFLFLMAAGVVVLSASCGVKGPPLPPEKPSPPPVRELKARVRDSCVELRWKPGKAKGPEPGAIEYQVLRAPVIPEAKEPPFKPLAEVSGLSYRDCTLPPLEQAWYAVRARSEQGAAGELSPPVMVENLPAPPAPLNLRATPGDEFIELRWDLPEELAGEAGFNIYRSQDPGRFPWKPLNPSLLRQGVFTDGPVANGVVYYYEVRAAVRGRGQVLVEGPAAAAAAAARDLVPPSPPRALSAFPAEGGVLLKWRSSPDPDTAGYLVYRRKRGEKEFILLTEEPVKETSWLDETAKRGIEYEYAVRAADDEVPPNLSDFSNRERVFAPSR